MKKQNESNLRSKKRSSVSKSNATKKPAKFNRQALADMDEAERLLDCLRANEMRLEIGTTAAGEPMTREQKHNLRWICQLQAEKLHDIFLRQGLEKYV